MNVASLSAFRSRFCGCLLLLLTLACESADGVEPVGSAAAGTAGASGHASSAGAAAASGTSAHGGAAGTGSAGGGSGGASGGPGALGCDAAGLTWKTARKTWYTSYPDPNSEECVKYNGCMWAGLFAACSEKKSEQWVAQRNIVAVFPGYEELELHDLCLKSGDKTMVVTVLDTCADSDCSGCCTTNQGSNDALIDLESHTNERFGVEDGQIQWADLGPTKTAGCD